MMNFGVQVVSLAVMLTIIFNFYRNKKMPLMSTKMFSAFLLISLFSILAEFATLYTIYNIDTVSPLLNRLCHQLFIGSLDLLAFFLFLYVDIKTHIQRRYKVIPMILRMLPLAFALFMVVFGDLYYYIGTDGRYSYGPMANTVYASSIVYIICTAFLLIRKNRRFTKEAKITVLIGMFVWIGIAVFQNYNPTVLISSMAVALMNQFVYISLENPNEFVNREIPGTLNHFAYSLILSEQMERRKPFYIIGVVLCQTELLQNSLGYKEVPQIMLQISQYLRGYTNASIYLMKENMVGIIVKNKKHYDRIMEQGMSKLEYQAQNGIRITPDCLMSVLECPKYADTMEDIFALQEFIIRKGKMYAKDNVLVVDDEIVQANNFHTSLELLVQKAIREDGLEVYYQPIYSTENKKFVSAEALVRLKDKETLGYISPEVFIPIAEESGIISELGNVVLEKVCEFASMNKLWDYGVKYIEVNISAIQSVDEDLPENIRGCMDRYHIQPEFINLEITETASVEAGDMLVRNMDKLRKIGCGFSMDDFGTGYSNLSKMAETKFDLIKLDKSLIWPCFEEENDNARSILVGCVEMIQGMGMHIVAEGVENNDHVELLTRLGVPYLQGYYFSRPIPQDEYLEFLKQKANG